MSNWHVSGRAWFKFRDEKKGKRVTVETDVDNMLLDVALYILGKYPGIELETSSIAINQRLSERVKA